ncbi:MAG: hypothetical protein U0T82_13840 [Bacteroidales bacterium]
MKRNLIYSMGVIALLLVSAACEKEQEPEPEPPLISVRTGAKQYLVNRWIDVSITNNYPGQIRYFLCDLEDLSPTCWLKKENGNWVEYPFERLCTQMGPMGYYGIIAEDETVKDSVTLFNGIGSFKLRYSFITGEDTLDFDSNEFRLFGLELR